MHRDFIDRARTRCHIRRTSAGLWQVTCTVPTRTGAIKICAETNEATIARLVQRNAPVGAFWHDIAKAARKIARSRAIASVLSQANKLASGPLGNILPPGVSQGIRLVYNARKTIARAKRGDQHARTIINHAARGGRPEVQQAIRAAIDLFRE